MVNNFSNIIKVKEHISPQLIEHKTTTYDIGDPSPGLELTIFTKNNKECTSGACEILVGAHQKFIMQGSLI